jgi:hypothetical protein
LFAVDLIFYSKLSCFVIIFAVFCCCCKGPDSVGSESGICIENNTYTVALFCYCIVLGMHLFVKALTVVAITEFPKRYP